MFDFKVITAADGSTIAETKSAVEGVYYMIKFGHDALVTLVCVDAKTGAITVDSY